MTISADFFSDTPDPGERIKATWGRSVVELLSDKAQTPAEIAALVTPTNYQYEPGDVRRYGAVGDDSTDNGSAISAAISTGHKLRGGGPEHTYRVATAITVSRSVDFDLEGATIKPVGNIRCFTRNSQAATVETTVSSGGGIGSRELTVVSATGIAAGQWCRVVADNTPTEQAGAYPSHWSKVTEVAGSVVSIDTPLQITYSGTITLQTYTSAQIISHFRLRNGTFDGSENTLSGSTGGAMRLSMFEEVDIDCTFTGWDNDSSGTVPVQIFIMIDARVRARFTDALSQGNQIDFQDCRSASLYDSVLEGSAFGCNITRCDFALFQGNHLMGRRKREHDDGISQRSVRGLKMLGCGSARIVDNHCVDYESPIKVEACHRYVVADNVVKNAGLVAGETDSNAINIGSNTPGAIMTSGVVTGNIVENCGGIAIGVSSDAAGKVIISNNQVKTCQSVGIYAPVRNAIITGNRVEDWGLRDDADEGIRTGEGCTVTNNRFRNDVINTLPCFFLPFTGSATKYYIDNSNVIESVNPMFAGGLMPENSGTATIASGATTVVVTHLLARTPRLQDISLTFGEQGTNDYGRWWISTITSTQFTINVSADPGASNLDVGWYAKMPQPYTVP